jgi:hypothetical protein
MLVLAAALAVVPPTPDWMGELYKDRPDTRLTQIVIPGTHDSGSFKIPTEGTCKLTAIAGANPVQAGAAKSNPCAAGRLAKAQSRSFTGQLDGGIRYLDIRLGVPANKVVKAERATQKVTGRQARKVPVYTHHTFISQRFRTSLKQIVGWANAHPKEQVILDFQHIDLTGKKRIDTYYTNAVAKMLRTYKVGGSTVCSRAWTTKVAPDIPNTTLGQAWAADRNLVVLHRNGQLPKNTCFRPREQILASQWPNTEDVATSDEENLKYLNARRTALAADSGCSFTGNEGPANQCGLFVSQLQLSMQFTNQAACISGTRKDGPCSLLELAQTRNPTVVAQMTAWKSRGLPVNISAVDFFEVGQTAAGQMALN